MDCKQATDVGRPAWSVEAGLSSWDALHAGEFDVVSDTVLELTGDAPITVADWISGNAGEMPLAPTSGDVAGPEPESAKPVSG